MHVEKNTASSWLDDMFFPWFLLAFKMLHQQQSEKIPSAVCGRWSNFQTLEAFKKS